LYADWPREVLTFGLPIFTLKWAWHSHVTCLNFGKESISRKWCKIEI